MKPGPLTSKQQKIVPRLESLFALAERIEARLAAAQRQVNALTPSLPPPLCFGVTGLARAFAGQLVPQDPTDEPASTLQAKIREAHAA